MTPPKSHLTAGPRLALAALTLMLGLPAPAYALSWSNCEGAPASLESWSGFSSAIYGRPSLTQGTVYLNRDFSAALPAVVEVEHAVDGRTIPCLDAFVGSCTYADLSDLLDHACASGRLYGACGCPLRSGVQGFTTFMILPDHGAMMLGSNTWTVKAYHPETGALEFCLDISAEVALCDDPDCPDDQSCDPVYCLQ